MADTSDGVPNGFDIDTDALADALHRLADGIRTGDVGITAIGTDEYVPCGDPIEHSVTLDYIPGTFDTAEISNDIVTLERRASGEMDDDGGEP